MTKSHKKKWAKKNVNDVEDFLRKETHQKRLAQEIKTRKNAELFIIDKSAGLPPPKQRAKDKVPSYEQFFTDLNYQPKKPEKKELQLVKPSAEAVVKDMMSKIKKKNKNAKEQVKVDYTLSWTKKMSQLSEPKGTKLYNLWTTSKASDAKPMGPYRKFQKKDKTKNPINQKLRNKSKYVPSVLPGVVVCSAGFSYRPSIADYQEAVQEAVEKSANIIAEQKRFEKDFPPLQIPSTTNLRMPIEIAPLYDSEEEHNLEEIRKKKKIGRKPLTLFGVKKLKRKLEKEKEKRLLLKQRILRSLKQKRKKDYKEIEVIQTQLKKTLQLARLKRRIGTYKKFEGRRNNTKTLRFGKAKSSFKDIIPIPPHPDSLPERLRSVKPLMNPFVDRIFHYRRRNMILNVHHMNYNKRKFAGFYKEWDTYDDTDFPTNKKKIK